MYFVFGFFDENEYKIEKLYLCIVIPLGILYCIANPLGMVPDEDQHARKSMAISNGIFFSHKDENGNPKDKFNAKLNETVTRTIESYEDAFRRVSLPETDEEIDHVNPGKEGQKVKMIIPTEYEEGWILRRKK